MRFAALPAGLAALAFPVLAETVEVDVELALMVDVSRSMGPAELEIQRRGYAEAIASDEVRAVTLNGSIARSAFRMWSATPAP